MTSYDTMSITVVIHLKEDGSDYQQMIHTQQQRMCYGKSMTSKLLCSYYTGLHFL